MTAHASPVAAKYGSIGAERAEPARGYPWLFSAPLDLTVFLGSALLSIAALIIGSLAGVLHDDTPSWAWLPAVLLVDVAHVWSTTFRTYLDPVARRRRPLLYLIVPVLCFGAAGALYSAGEDVFWHAMAYVAIFHFVRQQYGWVALYRACDGDRALLGRVIDVGAIYAATLYPLLHWHTHLPRRFGWFVSGDLVALPSLLERLARPMWVAFLCAYAARSAYRWLKLRRGNPGKDVVVSTTALCWWLGMVHFDSDYAFTVTNVFIHGVPYFALVYGHARRANATARAERMPGDHVPLVARGWIAFLSALWVAAYAEELLWDRAVWHERAWLFGAAWEVGAIHQWLVPLLVVPQLTHYVLDGFIWRRRTNPSVGKALNLALPRRG